MRDGIFPGTTMIKANHDELALTREENPAYLGSDVLVTRRAHEREADEEDVRLRVGEGSKSVVILLPGRIPQLYRLFST